MLQVYGRLPTTEEYERAFQMYGGNESEFLRQDCATINRIDLNRDARICKQCGSASLHDTSELAKAECSKCRVGHFNSGEFGGIS